MQSCMLYTPIKQLVDALNVAVKSTTSETVCNVYQFQLHLIHTERTRTSINTYSMFEEVLFYHSNSRLFPLWYYANVKWQPLLRALP